MSMMKTGFFTLAFAVIATISLERKAEAEPLHHEVQVVSGGRVVAETYAIRARDELSRVLPHFELFVEVIPHPGATTIKVTVVSPALRSGNEGRIREILEASVRKPYVIVNGYAGVRQTRTTARASR